MYPLPLTRTSTTKRFWGGKKQGKRKPRPLPKTTTTTANKKTKRKTKTKQNKKTNKQKVLFAEKDDYIELFPCKMQKENKINKTKTSHHQDLNPQLSSLTG